MSYELNVKSGMDLSLSARKFSAIDLLLVFYLLEI